MKKPVKAKVIDNSKRSLVKAITYRAIIMCSDGIIIYAITHRYDVALTVILFSNIASTVLYYLHERVWARIHWGKIVAEK
jgi:uncharacterized membrane protein